MCFWVDNDVCLGYTTIEIIALEGNTLREPLLAPRLHAKWTAILSRCRTLTWLARFQVRCVISPNPSVFDTPVNLREPRRLLAPTCSDAKSIHRATLFCIPSPATRRPPTASHRNRYSTPPRSNAFPALF